MAGNKYISLVAGILTEIASVIASTGAGDSGKIVALNASGLIDDTMLPTSSSVTMTPSETINAGALINVFDSGSGVMKVRNASNATQATRAHGYAPGAMTTGVAGPVILRGGANAAVSGLTGGANYFLGTAGGVVTTAPSGSANIVQSVGFAKSTTELDVIIGGIVVLA